MPATGSGDSWMEIRILGPLEVIDADGAGVVSAAKARCVLAVLAVNAGRVVSTETLVDAVWDESPPPSALATLQTYVYQLRKALGTKWVETEPTGYRLAMERADVDGLRFEDLVRAHRESHENLDRSIARLSGGLGWWRGAALADFHGQSWAQPVIARLDALRLEATEHLLRARLSRGEHAALVPELETLVARYPLHEPLWRDLMLALYRSNRQADALRAYQRLRAQLQTELGISPSAELAGLEVAILDHAPELEVQPFAASTATAPGAKPEVMAAAVEPRRRRSRARVAATIAVVSTLVATASAVALSASNRHPRAAPAPFVQPSGYQPRYHSISCPTQPRIGDSSMRCGTLTVPENRSRPRGRTVQLGVFRYPALGSHFGRIPVVQIGSVFRLAESPGDASLRLRGESIYLAGRGFYGSNPRLTCPEVTASVDRSLGRRLRDPVNTVEFLRAASACRARWAGRGVDLSSYSARERADDVRDLAIVLSLPKIDFVAGGLGTVDARELAGRYPQLVHSITLFNVTPPETNSWNGAITNAAGALDRYFGECTNDRSCVEQYPSLRSTFIATYARLQSAPAAYTTTSPTGDGRKVPVLLDGDRAAQIMLLALDNPDALSLVPVAVAGDESGQAVVDFGARALVFPVDASWGALFSRTCIDDVTSVGQDGLKVEAEAEPWLAFVADDPLLDVCTVWPTKPAASRAPAPASVPTLVLQGDLDPFTSRGWADEAARAFVHASIISLPHSGPVASIATRCVAEIRQQFLAEPARRVAPETCVRSIPSIRFAGT